MSKPVTARIETYVAAPPETVYDVLTDREGYGALLPVSTRLVSPGEDQRQGVGAVHSLGLGPVEVREQITELVPGRRMAYRVAAGIPARSHTGTVELVAKGAGTMMVYRMTNEPVLPAPAALLRPALELLIRTLSRAIKLESERRVP